MKGALSRMASAAMTRAPAASLITSGGGKNGCCGGIRVFFIAAPDTEVADGNAGFNESEDAEVLAPGHRVDTEHVIRSIAL